MAHSTHNSTILGRDLREGVRVKTWFMPKGTAVIAAEPYRGTLEELRGARVITFNAATSSGAVPMTVCDFDRFEAA